MVEIKTLETMVMIIVGNISSKNI